MTDIAARHVPLDTGNECAYCFYESWPCDAELLRRERDEALAQLKPIEWWYCVWCETKYPYTDSVDALKDHSRVCEAHPGNAHAKALAEALRAFGERTLDDGTICYCIAGAAGPDGHEDVCSDARRALTAYDKDHER